MEKKSKTLGVTAGLMDVLLCRASRQTFPDVKAAGRAQRACADPFMWGRKVKVSIRASFCVHFYPCLLIRIGFLFSKLLLLLLPLFYRPILIKQSEQSHIITNWNNSFNEFGRCPFLHLGRSTNGSSRGNFDLNRLVSPQPRGDIRRVVMAGIILVWSCQCCLDLRRTSLVLPEGGCVNLNQKHRS